MPIQKVDGNTILEKVGLRELWIRRNPTAIDVRMHLDRMFRLAIHQKYYRGENPASWERLQHVLPAVEDVHQEKHLASLPYKDAGRFMRDLRAYDDRSWRKQGHTTAAFLLEFVMLAGVRVGEAAAAQWKEIDRENMVWNVPPEHLKSRDKLRPVPITKPMLALLDNMYERRRDESRDALVFPSPNGRGEIDDTTVRRVIRRLKWGDSKITIPPPRSKELAAAIDPKRQNVLSHEYLRFLDFFVRLPSSPINPNGLAIPPKRQLILHLRAISLRGADP
jgi:integrase